jgi:hypothetical protein
MRSLKSDLNHTKIIMRDIIFSWEWSAQRESWLSCLEMSILLQLRLTKTKAVDAKLSFRSISKKGFQNYVQNFDC